MVRIPLGPTRIRLQHRPGGSPGPGSLTQSNEDTPTPPHRLPHRQLGPQARQHLMPGHKTLQPSAKGLQTGAESPAVELQNCSIGGCGGGLPAGPEGAASCLQSWRGTLGSAAGLGRGACTGPGSSSRGLSAALGVLLGNVVLRALDSAVQGCRVCRAPCVARAPPGPNAAPRPQRRGHVPSCSGTP